MVMLFARFIYLINQEVKYSSIVSNCSFQKYCTVCCTRCTRVANSYPFTYQNTNFILQFPKT